MITIYYNNLNYSSFFEYRLIGKKGKIETRYNILFFLINFLMPRLCKDHREKLVNCSNRQSHIGFLYFNVTTFFNATVHECKSFMYRLPLNAVPAIFIIHLSSFN